MSFITDQIRRIDAHLDRSQPRFRHQTGGSDLQSSTSSFPSRSNLTNEELEASHNEDDLAGSEQLSSEQRHRQQAQHYSSSLISAASSSHRSKRVEQLESLIRTVTGASANQTIMPVTQLLGLVTQASAGIATSQTPASPMSPSQSKGHGSRHGSLASTSSPRLGRGGDTDGDSFGHGSKFGNEDAYGEELEWLLISKIAAQVQGHLLKRLLEEITPVMDDLYYWDTVLGSWHYSALYMVQQLPFRLYRQGIEAMDDARESLAAMRERGIVTSANEGVTQEWRRFYRLVRDSVRARQLNDIQTRLLSPVNAARLDARDRRKGLSKQKEMCAAAIGVLTNESLNPGRISPSSANVSFTSSDEWKNHLANSVQLMSATISQVSYVNVEPKAYEQTVLKTMSNGGGEIEGYRQIYGNLNELLVHVLPQHSEAYREQRSRFGRPSRWVRYWLPASALFFSSTTLLKILVNRKADIMTWVRDFGKTTIAFWDNWVVEPTRDIIKTIRHDKDSEIALMSRESLESDRASLERMVVDFAVENPASVGNGPLDDAAIGLIRQKVREGDLTPILRAYEHDLKRPFARAITGNLVRELLIQIQKTKVDVELAMSGIDSLLKSQELVFGFVGLTPGILVCIMAGRWLSETFGGRSGRRSRQLQGRLIRVIRNIDRILSKAEPQEHGLLSYKDHGLILCEVQVLQANSGRVLPGDINREFLEDIKDLTDIRLGIERQIKVVDRLRWAYWKWLS